MVDCEGQRVNDGRCPHCGIAHEQGIRVCPSTGLLITPAPAAPGGARRAAIAPRPPSRAAVAPKPPPPVGRDELVGSVIGDKYAINGILGEGGMGVVYEAEHMAMGRIVAIKVLHPENAQKREAVSRLQHEAKVTGNLGHPNICEIYDMGRLEDGSPYVVMERLRGETLADRIKRDGKVEPGPVVEIAIQVLSALAAAHASGIIHRDLKPENVFLAEKPGGLVVTKLLDFGISKAMLAAGDEDRLGLTQTGMVMGTPYYMAPEQARGDRALDNRVDLWAVGVMMYEAMTGRRPFLAKNYNALLVKILTVWHRSLAEVDPTIPPALALAVDKALSKMPEDRYRNAADMQEALKRFLPRKDVAFPSSFALPSVRPVAESTAATSPAAAKAPAANAPAAAKAPGANAPAAAKAPVAPAHASKAAAPAAKPPTFGLPELDLHEDTADGVPWTAVKQYVPTGTRNAVNAAIAANQGGAQAPQQGQSPPQAQAPQQAHGQAPQQAHGQALQQAQAQPPQQPSMSSPPHGAQAYGGSPSPHAGGPPAHTGIPAPRPTPVMPVVIPSAAIPPAARDRAGETGHGSQGSSGASNAPPPSAAPAPAAYRPPAVSPSSSIRYAPVSAAPSGPAPAHVPPWGHRPDAPGAGASGLTAPRPAQAPLGAPSPAAGPLPAPSAPRVAARRAAVPPRPTAQGFASPSSSPAPGVPQAQPGQPPSPHAAQPPPPPPSHYQPPQPPQPLPHASAYSGSQSVTPTQQGYAVPSPYAPPPPPQALQSAAQPPAASPAHGGSSQPSAASPPAYGGAPVSARGGQISQGSAPSPQAASSPPRPGMPPLVSPAPVAGRGSADPFAPRPGPAARVSQAARAQRSPFPSQNAGVPVQAAPPPPEEVHDDTTIMDDSSDGDGDDDQIETLVLVRDKLPLAKKLT